MRTTLRLLATALLGLLYVAAAYLMTQSRVSAEYRAHYLVRTADCWLPNGRLDAPAQAATVEIAALAYPEACRFLRLHWGEVAPWGVRMHAEQAELRLPWRPGAAAVELTLLGPDRDPAPVRATITLGGATEAAELARGQEKALVLALPHADPGQAWTITLRASPRPGRAGLVRIRYLDHVPG